MNQETPSLHELEARDHLRPGCPACKAKAEYITDLLGRITALEMELAEERQKADAKMVKLSEFLSEHGRRGTDASPVAAVIRWVAELNAAVLTQDRQKLDAKACPDCGGTGKVYVSKLNWATCQTCARGEEKS
jgi:hypothetical protein